MFDTPKDKIVWDVGHQAYPHKILTGRRSRIRTLRQGGGCPVSPSATRANTIRSAPPTRARRFRRRPASPSRATSPRSRQPRDRCRRRRRDDRRHDLRGAEQCRRHAHALIVILNDNDMSIAPPDRRAEPLPVAHGVFEGLSPGAQSRPSVRRAGDRPRGFTKKAEHSVRNFAMGGDLFDALGFYYVGPIDGHDLDTLIPVLENARDMENGPVLVHVVTQKGKGYEPAENAEDKYHGVSKFNVSPASRPRRKPARRATRRCSRRNSSAACREGPRRWSPSPPRCPRARASTCSAKNFRIAASMSASPNSTR